MLPQYMSTRRGMRRDVTVHGTTVLPSSARVAPGEGDAMSLSTAAGVPCFCL